MNLQACSLHRTSKLSTRIKDAGIAIRHSRGYIISILKGPERGWRGCTRLVHTHKKEVVPLKKTCFCYRKHIEDVNQDQKTAPDLLESMIRFTRLAKEELQRILMKMNQFRSKIQDSRVCSFQMSGKSTDSRRRPTQPSRLVSFKPITAFQT